MLLGNTKLIAYQPINAKFPLSCKVYNAGIEGRKEKIKKTNSQVDALS